MRGVREHLDQPDLRLSVTLDYHANVTEEMVRYPDAMLGYDTYPHIDWAELQGPGSCDESSAVLRR